MRLPDPIANTTTEAYLAYKAGVLEESELKPKLYYPTDHFDAWLALWTGLTTEYPTRGCISSNKLTLVARKNTAYGVGCKPIVSPTVRLYGTATRSDGISIAENLEPDLPIGEYTFTLDSAQSGVVNLIATTEEDGNIAFRLTAGQTYITKTLPSKVVKLQLFVGITNGDNYDDVSFKCALTEGSSQATVFEPSVEPEMLCDEEALVAYLAGVTNTYPDSVKDPYDVRIAGYLRYLVSARFGRPEYPVNNEELYLSMLKPPVVTNDTPSSNIELANTCEGPFIDVKMYGDTSQQTYTGKNLFDIDQYTNAVIRGGGTAVSVEKTDSTTLKMTNLIGQSNNFVMVPLPDVNSLLNKTLTVSFDAELTNITNTKVSFYWLSDVNYTEQLGDFVQVNSNGSYSVTATVQASIPSGSTRLAVALYAAGSTQPVSSIVEYSNVQVEVGSTATSYEPYVGGVPAPNPDYPQVVKTVTGRQAVKVEGKNLFDCSGYSHSSNGLTNTLNPDGTITTTGVPTYNYTRVVPNLDITDILEDGATYVVSKTIPEAYLAVQVIAKRVGEGNDYYTGSFTVDKTTHSYYMITVQTTTVEAWGDQPRTITGGYQLEKGSEPTPFEPYTSWTKEGKNLCAVADTEFVHRGVNVVVRDGMFILNGTATSSGTQYLEDASDDLLNGTYTTSVRYLGGSISQNSGGNFNLRNEDDTLVGGSQCDLMERDTTRTYTVSNQRVLFGLYVLSGATFDNYRFKVQVEEGPDATDYEPYKPLFEINLGKNLFGLNDAIQSNGVRTETTNGVMKVSGKATSNQVFLTNYQPCTFPAGDYTITVKDPATRRIIFRTFDENNVEIRSSYIEQGRVYANIHIDGSEAKYRLVMLASSGNTYDFEYDVQIERGLVPTTYAPYFTPVELCKIGDYQDYIYENDGKWYVRKAIGKYSLVQGSELGENGIGQDFVSMLTPELPTITSMAHNAGLCRSNMYLPVDSNGTGLSGSTPAGRIRVYTSFKYANTYNGVRAIAQEKGLVIYYPLATATDTEITNTALIDQLDALKAGGSYNEKTYIKITATDPNLPALLKVEAGEYR